MKDDRLDIAVLFDAPEENWPSMDLVGEMLLEQWRSTLVAQVAASGVTIPIPRVARRFPGAGAARAAFNADRALARYVAYPLRALATRRRRRFFHVVDHSYAQLVHALPASRTGVYCHDLDAFQPVLSPGKQDRSPWFRALARVLLTGLRAAAVVFHSTHKVGRLLESDGLVPRSRLVYAPYGVAPEFDARPDTSGAADAVLASLGGQPFVLHVGSEIPRKRLDVLFEVFARLRATRPGLRLVQQGATLSEAQRAHVVALGIEGALVQPPKVDRKVLAGLYKRASAVLVPSDAEGFGLPVIEALACGALVVASDIPVLREVGGDAAVYAPPGDVAAWSSAVDAALSGSLSVPGQARRLAHASRFTWEEHARTILGAYRDLAASNRA